VKNTRRVALGYKIKRRGKKKKRKEGVL